MWKARVCFCILMSQQHYHVQCWTERILPERAQDLARAETKAANDYQKHQGAYHTAALAEATLDGIEIVR